MMPRTSPCSFSGFSLVELLVSVAIISVLASVAMPVVELARKREKEAELRAALHDIRRAIDAYKDASAAHRIPLADGASGYPPTLTELVVGVPDLANPSGPNLYFLRRVPRDPLNSDTSIATVDTWAPRSFASPANAPKPGDDVFDVSSTSPEVGLNGVPYAEW